MKDSEFIELLNLYLDHEISGSDAIRLEAEVQADPARRQVYEQYCRMQKACKVLVREFHPETTAAATAVERKIIAFDPAVAAARQRRISGFYTAGAFAAAAACVAVIFVGRSRQQAADAAQAIAAQTPVQVAPAAPPVSAPRGGGIVSVASRPGSTRLVGDPLLLTGAQSSEASYTNVSQQNLSESLAWIQTVQLPPLQQRAPVEDFRFDLRPPALRLEGRPLGGTRPPAETEVEMIAFRIIK